MTRFTTATVIGILLLTGCQEGGRSDKPVGRPFEGQTISVAVPEESGFADVLEADRGEWAAQTGAALEIRPYRLPDGDGRLREVLSPDDSPADVLIYPVASLGELATAGMLAPLSDDIIDAPRFDWRDVFGVLRDHVAVWGREQVVAVPLGSPVTTYWYRRDVLKARGLEPPKTWDEFLKLAEGLAGDRSAQADDATGAGDRAAAVALPLGPSSRRELFLSLAAPYAKHRDNYSFFFKVDTMEPLIASEGFVRALETLVRLKQLAPAEAIEWDAAAVRRAFWKGEAPLALVWGWSRSDEVADRAPGLVAGFAELPGATEVFNTFQGEWARVDDPDGNRVPFVGWEGWAVSMSAGTPRGQGAAYLLTRLVTEPLADGLLAAAGGTTCFRSSQLGGLSARLSEGPATADEAAEYTGVLATALSRDSAVADLRIPGRERYHRALDDGLSRALVGDVGPKEALEGVARQWGAITEELGARAQRRVYNKSLGLKPVDSP